MRTSRQVCLETCLLVYADRFTRASIHACGDLSSMEKVGEILKSQGGVTRYRGFSKPNTTPTPDDLFDTFLSVLTHAELKVLLYITRRTFGFKKTNDRISLRQIAGGIVAKDGKRLDSGAGVNRRTAMRVVKRLESMGLITVKRVRTEDGYNRVNVYSLRFREG